MNITNTIKYIGVPDRVTDLFEGQYVIPNGVTYNSYVIFDDKIAVMDTVDVRFCDEWLSNLASALDGRSPDYLIVQHMEPDHSSSIARFAEIYPNVTIVSSDKAFTMMGQFFGEDYSDRRLVVKDGATLDLGGRTLTFVAAPMVHWPEVIVTYDSLEKVLFSADAFGRFGQRDDSDWVDEARRYYIGIVGKYGMQVTKLLAKASTLDIAAICPLHGPTLTENLGFYLEKYTTWASYAVEEAGTVIAYASIYGNTKKVAENLRDELIASGKTAVLYDLNRCDVHAAIADAFRFDSLVLASVTYNNGIFPTMRAFISGLVERGYTGRKVGIVENGSWAPASGKLMREMLGECKNLTLCETTVTVKSAANDATAAAISALVGELK